VEPREPAFLTVSLDPNPTIEAYKKDVDRTLLRENLRLTTTERVRKMIAALRFAETVRTSRVKGASIASEPRDRSAPAKRSARERVGESEGRSPSDVKTGTP
jgi:hypothetical protein